MRTIKTRLNDILKYTKFAVLNMSKKRNIKTSDKQKLRPSEWTEFASRQNGQT